MRGKGWTRRGRRRGWRRLRRRERGGRRGWSSVGNDISLWTCRRVDALQIQCTHRRYRTTPDEPPCSPREDMHHQVSPLPPQSSRPLPTPSRHPPHPRLASDSSHHISPGRSHPPSCPDGLRRAHSPRVDELPRLVRRSTSVGPSTAGCSR